MRPGNIKYERLRVEMAIRNLYIKDLADELKVTRDTMSNKLSGETNFTLKEALTIQKKFFSDIPVWDLFREIVEAVDAELGQPHAS